MLQNSTKGWHLCCHKHQCRNLSAYRCVEISVHIDIFLPVKASFFLEKIQKSGLIIEMTMRVKKESGIAYL